MPENINYSAAEKKAILDEAGAYIIESFNQFKKSKDSKNIPQTIVALATLVDAVAGFRALNVIFFNKEREAVVQSSENMANACIESTIKLIEKTVNEAKE